MPIIIFYIYPSQKSYSILRIVLWEECGVTVTNSYTFCTHLCVKIQSIGGELKARYIPYKYCAAYISLHYTQFGSESWHHCHCHQENFRTSRCDRLTSLNQIIIYIKEWSQFVKKKNVSTHILYKYQAFVHYFHFIRLLITMFRSLTHVYAPTRCIQFFKLFISLLFVLSWLNARLGDFCRLKCLLMSEWCFP